MNQERTLNKIDNENYELRVNQPDNKLLQIKQYTKGELKDLYKEMRAELLQLRTNTAQLKKKLENAPDWSEQELEIKRVVEKVLATQEIEKEKKQLEYQEGLIDTNIEYMKEIEIAIPELTRNN